MGDGDRERDRDLGVEMGMWRVEMGIWGVEMGIWGWGSLPILPSKESSGREWGGLVLQGNPHIVVCPCFSVDL